LKVSEAASRKAEDTMLHHDFSRAVIKDRVARYREEAQADQAAQEREEPSERSGKTGAKSLFLRVARSLPRLL